MAVISKVRKQGGAAVMTLPPAVLKSMNIAIGAEIELRVEHGTLLAQPATRTRQRYSIAELLEGSAEMEKLNAAVAWAMEGDPAGHEIA